MKEQGDDTHGVLGSQSGSTALIPQCGTGQVSWCSHPKHSLILGLKQNLVLQPGQGGEHPLRLVAAPLPCQARQVPPAWVSLPIPRVPLELSRFSALCMRYWGVRRCQTEGSSQHKEPVSSLGQFIT